MRSDTIRTLRKRGSLAVLLTVSVLATGYATLKQVVHPVTVAAFESPATENPTAPYDFLTWDVLSRLNAERAAAGLPELVDLPEAREVATVRASDMAANGYLAHLSPTGVDAEYLLRERAVGMTLVGENISRSSYPPEMVSSVVCSAWMASEGHRDNILDPRFARAGIGVAYGDGKYYFAAVFLD
jgi:uncharacterized protein YkwD